MAQLASPNPRVPPPTPTTDHLDDYSTIPEVDLPTDSVPDVPKHIPDLQYFADNDIPYHSAIESYFEPVFLKLQRRQEKWFPSPGEFAGLVLAKRETETEVVGAEEWAGGEEKYRRIVETVRKVGGGGEARVYKCRRAKIVEYWVVAWGVKEGGLLGVRVQASVGKEKK